MNGNKCLITSWCINELEYTRGIKHSAVMKINTLLQKRKKHCYEDDCYNQKARLGRLGYVEAILSYSISRYSCSIGSWSRETEQKKSLFGDKNNVDAPVEMRKNMEQHSETAIQLAPRFEKENLQNRKRGIRRKWIVETGTLKVLESGDCKIHLGTYLSSFQRLKVW